MGKLSKSKGKRLLTPGGTFVTVNSMKVAEETTDNLLYLRELAEAGVLTPVVDRRYGMEQAAEAHRYVDAGHLGVKTGRGFYEYPDPAYQRPDFVTGPRVDDA